MFRIFVGYDERESHAFDACVESIYSNTVQSDYIAFPLIKEKITGFCREKYYPDEVVATDFAFSRFLVPRLCNYEGWALFCDCDFIFTRDIAELFALRNDDYSVMCVKHDYTCKDTVKMDNQKQIHFPRKNWSSCMLFNCSHPDCKNLSVDSVNKSSPAYLHQMKWTTDDKIGSLPLEWNWLVGEYNKSSLEGNTPAVLHYTLGCPFMEGYEDCDFANEYWKYAKPIT